MNDYSEQVLQCRLRGLSCSQTLMEVVGLRATGAENSGLVKAMRGLTYGMFCQHTCGALTGAACALALHDDEREMLGDWCKELSEWFEEEFGAVRCADILGKGQSVQPVCMDIIQRTVERSLEILEQADCI